MFTCPECDTPINQASEECPHCGADLRAPAVTAEEGISPPNRRAKKTAMGVAVLLGFIGLIMWYSLSIRPTGQRTAKEAQARHTLVEVQQALASYASAEGHYPSSLEELGATVRAAAQSAQSAGYELQYLPGQPGPGGVISDYSLLARPSNYGYLNFFSDASGVIRATRDQRAANVDDPPD